MTEHDPIKFAGDLGAKLATTSRHVCLFLGAGVACACGLPGMTALQNRVLQRLPEPERNTLTQQLEEGNLEQVLSRLRRIAALLKDDQKVDQLTGAEARVLDEAICAAIVNELDVADADLAPALHLAAWVARADYRLPVELFTVNYDLLIETALERMRVAYFDGFIGTLRAQFQTELVEGTPRGARDTVPAFFARLWKLHGSLNWEWDEAQHIVRLGQPVTGGRVAAIYPSDAKYEESRRVPFVVLQDRFRRALHQPETLVLVTGYSFSDQHLNEMLFEAAARRERSEILAFCHSGIPDVLAEKAMVTPNLQVVAGSEAILGGLRAPWKDPSDPPTDIWDAGQFGLREFKYLASYLARSASREPEANELLTALLDQITPTSSPDTDAGHHG